MVKSHLLLLSILLFSFANLNPSFGQVELRGLVLLVDFADDPEDLPLDRVDSLINGISYTEALVPSSLRNYYLQQSRDSISLSHEIFGYYQAPETAAWYAEQPWTVVYDLLTDALDSVVAQNPDYDWDELSLSTRPGFEGTFLSVNVVTTAWVAGSGGTHYLPGGTWTAPNGVAVRAFTSQALTSPWDPTLVRLFVIAHEIGHAAWGFPDTYDYDGSSYGTGFYSVMSGNQVAGEVEPIGGPFFVKTGWSQVVDILPNTTYALPQDGKLVARYINPSNPNEYFIIEACKNSTMGNAAFPVERGLVIWHIDEGVTTTNTLENMTFEEHYAHSIEQADGQFDLENGVNQGDAGDIYVEGSLFNNSSIPSSTWWNGEASGIDINSIQFLVDNTIQFCNGICNSSIPTYAFESLVHITPNQTNDGITITISNLSEGQYSIEILNALGELVYITSLDAQPNELEKTQVVDLQNESAGLFIVRITDVSNGRSTSKKIVLN